MSDELRAVAERLRQIAGDESLLEIARLAIEDALVEWRDSRMSQIRGSGFVIRERDGSNSDIIRFGPEHGMRIGLKAIADHLEKANG